MFGDTSYVEQSSLLTIIYICREANTAQFSVYPQTNWVESKKTMFIQLSNVSGSTWIFRLRAKGELNEHSSSYQVHIIDVTHLLRTYVQKLPIIHTWRVCVVLTTLKSHLALKGRFRGNSYIRVGCRKRQNITGSQICVIFFRVGNQYLAWSVSMAMRTKWVLAVVYWYLSFLRSNCSKLRDVSATWEWTDARKKNVYNVQASHLPSATRNSQARGCS